MGPKILWAVVGGFLAGVFVRSFAHVSWPLAAFCVLLGLFALAFIGIDRQKKHLLVVLAVACLAFAGGVMRMDMATLQSDAHFAPLVGKNVTIEGTVAEEPDAREASLRLTVDADSLITKEGSVPVRARILVVAPAHSSERYGDAIRASGRLDAPEPFDTGLGHVFNYPMYLGKDGILYELSFAKVETTGRAFSNPAKHFALGVKSLLLDGLNRALPQPEAGLAAGITLGDKRSVGPELSQAFVRASLIHIVVLSGYNITVVINAASASLSYLPRVFRFGASGLVVAFFILMTGGAATSVRAGLMAFLAVYARLTGRTFLALRALGATALLMILWNPWTLCFDPSFQLSALATLGLVLFTQLYAGYLAWLPLRFGFREIVASTLATQTAVLPLLLYQSGNLSLVALPANLLALVAVPAAMALSAFAALVGLFAGPYSVFAGFPAYLLLTYIVHVAELLSSVPFAAVGVPAFSAWWLAGAYAMILGAFYFGKKRAVKTKTGA